MDVQWIELFESGADNGIPVYWMFEDSIDNGLEQAPSGTDTHVLYGWHRTSFGLKFYTSKNIPAIITPDNRVFAFKHKIPSWR